MFAPLDLSNLLQKDGVHSFECVEDWSNGRDELSEHNYTVQALFSSLKRWVERFDNKLITKRVSSRRHRNAQSRTQVRSLSISRNSFRAVRHH